ncbi:MAG: cellulase family glycosylhydrolase, partial [Saccharofermentans sp.]|nr:cellulase family glycosylhydrolase [Saccharofermentans sp.]
MRRSRLTKVIGLVLTIAILLEFPGIGLLSSQGLFSYDVQAASTSNDWLHTSGGKIVDSEGNEVRLTGVNWFGYATGTNVFDGCWQVSMDSTLKAVADHGFNLIRLPISTELVLNWKNGVYPQANINMSTNSNLAGMNSLQILDHAVAKCKEYGIKIMFDIHCLNSDSMGHNYEYWYNGSYSEDKWIESLQWLTTHYRNDDTVIAMDLKNEPHG